KAPIYTLIYNPKEIGDNFKYSQIRTSFLQKIPFAKRYYRFFPILMPMAIEKFDFSYYDLVISDSSSFAKGIITKPCAKHICYCHTPMRFAWDDCQKYLDEFNYYPKFAKKIAPFGMNYVRMWDQVAGARPDFFIANSQFISDRIKKYYNRQSQVIYPPVNVRKIQEKIKNLKPEKEYFLALARFLPNKKLDIAIDAFNNLGLPLKIVGSGPLYNFLKKKSKNNIEFLGNISEENLPTIYAQARGFICPQEEDFGIAPIEAMAAGTPIIAYRSGGITETVEDRKTGIFFNNQTAKSLEEAVKKFISCENQFNREEIMHCAENFDKEIFKKKIKEFIGKI
ncbi:MAG: glycosyltransferase, partial [bacterium]